MKRIFLPLVLIIAFALAACGTSAPTEAPSVITEVPVQSTATTLPFPSGRFIKPGTTNYGLMFNNEDGTFTVFEGENIFVHATYKVEGNVFTETSNDGGCETNMSFYYLFDGSKLTFSYVGDPAADTACDGRHTDFNNGSFILTPLSLPFPSGKFMRSDRVEPAGLIFNEDGTWEGWDKNFTLAEGSYSVEGDIFTELSNNQGCSAPMSFKYAFDGKNLTFSYVGDAKEDKCDGRRAAMDNVTYVPADE